jgi:hypothetical protein
MAGKRKPKQVAKRRAKKNATKRKVKKAPRGLVSAREASEILKMTTSGVYTAIKRGEFPVTKVDGQIFLSRRDVMEGLQERIEFYSRPKPDPMNLTDDEFLQRLWDSDPD